MIRAIAIRRFLGVMLLLAHAGVAHAQTIENPVLPRGSLFFRMDPSATTVEGTYGAGGTGEIPLGESFSFSSIGSDDIPGLQPAADRFGALAGLVDVPSVHLGSTAARFSGDERILPLHLSYGVFDRITVGVTVPIIRKRVETILRVRPEGANVGESPLGSGSAVTTFLADASGSLTAVQTSVDDTCLQLGEQHTECLVGRSLVTEADAFLSDLDSAYREEDVFPLDGSAVGNGISARWADLLGRFTDWGATGPEVLPLASDPIEQGTFESLAVSPAWPAGGFPLETPEAVLGLGDVEVNVAVGLLSPDPPPLVPNPNAVPELVLHLAAVGTFRFATGSADSLRIVAPMYPPRGVSGLSVGVIADVVLPSPLDRLGILGTLESGWNGDREMTLLAPDPTLAFTPEQTRSEVSWSPGSHVRGSLTPRFRFGPGLSLGVGWRFLRQEPDEFALPVGSESGSSTLPADGIAYTQHRIGLELRYSAMQGRILDGVPFPFEVLLRASRSMGGSETAPVESRAEAMLRFRLRE